MLTSVSWAFKVDYIICLYSKILSVSKSDKFMMTLRWENSRNVSFFLLHWQALPYWRLSNVPISCLPPSRVDPEVQELNVIIDCPQSGSSRAGHLQASSSQLAV